MKSSPFREEIIRQHNLGIKQSQIVKNLPSVSKDVVSNTVKRYKELGPPEDRKGRGRKPKLDEKEIIRRIKDKLRRPGRGRQSVRRISASLRGIKISKSRVHQLMKSKPLSSAVCG